MNEQPKIWQTKFLKKILDDDERTTQDLADKILKKILDDDERTTQDLADEIFEKNFG